MDDERVLVAVAWLRTWGVEAALGTVALVGAVVGALEGRGVTVVVAGALAVATADRLRLRLDNQSLTASVVEMREGRVSRARLDVDHGDGENMASGTGERAE